MGERLVNLLAAIRRAARSTWTLRAVEAVFAVLLLARWGDAARRVLSCVAGSHFEGDDWSNLAGGRHIAQAISRMWGTEVFRPVTPALFGFLHDVVGLQSRGFLVFFLGVNVVAAVMAARLFHRLGFTYGAGALAGMMVLISRITVESFNFFTQQQLTVARLATFGALHALLEPGEGRGRWWLPWALLALGLHEQAVLVVPLLWLCVVYRDGVTGARVAFARRDVQELHLLVGAYVALHVIGFPAGYHHALSWRALPEKVEVFRSLTTTALYWRSLGWMHDPQRAALTLAGALWVVARSPRGARAALFCATWMLVGFSLYFLALNSTSGYFFNVAETGLALAVGAMLDFGVRARSQPLLLRFVFIAFALESPVAGSARTQDLCGHDRMDDSPRILALVAPAARAAVGAFTPVVFVVNAPVSLDDSAVTPRPYLGALCGDFDFNGRIVATDMERNLGLQVTFPGRRFRVWVLHRDDLPWACVRRGDAVIRAVEETPRHWRYDAVPAGCGAAWSAPPPEGDPLRAAAWRFWQARLAFDDVAARAAADEVERVGAAPPPGTPAARIVEAVRALRPL